MTGRLNRVLRPWLCVEASLWNWLTRELAHAVGLGNHAVEGFIDFAKQFAFGFSHTNGKVLIERIGADVRHVNRHVGQIAARTAERVFFKAGHALDEFGASLKQNGLVLVQFLGGETSLDCRDLRISWTFVTSLLNHGLDGLLLGSGHLANNDAHAAAVDGHVAIGIRLHVRCNLRNTLDGVEVNLAALIGCALHSNLLLAHGFECFLPWIANRRRRSALAGLLLWRSGLIGSAPHLLGSNRGDDFLGTGVDDLGHHQRHGLDFDFDDGLGGGRLDWSLRWSFDRGLGRDLYRRLGWGLGRRLRWRLGGGLGGGLGRRLGGGL